MVGTLGGNSARLTIIDGLGKGLSAIGVGSNKKAYGRAAWLAIVLANDLHPRLNDLNRHGIIQVVRPFL